jgi:hypothetical protein
MMTFENLLKQSERVRPLMVSRLDIRYASKTARISIKIPDVTGDQVPTAFDITLHDLYLCCIEPPAANYVDDYWEDGGGELYVSSSMAHQSRGVEEITAQIDAIPVASGLLRARLLIHDWNSYIHLVYRTSTISSENTYAI